MKCSRVIFAPRKASPGPLVLTAYLTPPQLKVRALVKTRSSRRAKTSSSAEGSSLSGRWASSRFCGATANLALKLAMNCGKKRLGLLDRGDVAQPHLLDQAILQGLIGALDTPLGLRRQRANLLDAQALGHAVELGLAVAAQSFFGVDAKDAMTIRVERQRRPIRQEMAAQRDEIGLRRLRRRHVQRGQTPRRVVDEHDQGAARRPALEPVVLAAVDLNELAEPWPPLAQQERPPRLARLRLPKAKSDLKPPYALTRDRDPLDLGELFGGQGRAKAGVLAEQKPFDPFTDARPEPPQRNPPTLLGDKPGVALPPIGANQPFHLPNANPQPLARRALAESLCNHKSNNMRALTFSATHPQNLVPQTSPLPESAEKGTFSRCTKGTFPCCGNTVSCPDSRPVRKMFRS